MANNGDDEPMTEEEFAIMKRHVKKREERLALLATLEQRLGIKVGFIEETLKESDDWSMIIKLAVIIEASLTHALVLHVKNTELFDHFADLSNNRRLQLARKLGIIDQPDLEALDIIAWMRNRFAHNVKYLGSTLWSFFDEQTDDRKAVVLNKLLRREGKDKIKATDKMSGYKLLFATTVQWSVISSLRTIANHGNAAVAKLEEEQWKNWSIKQLFASENGEAWWQSGSSPVGADTPLVLKEAAKAAAKK
jgi:hypothetical protein